ncbi:AAA family ATPase [Candidatus Woesearchaeota archaeon]|jgi:tRNA uridine 5-carbamoylmethylation protein Kti12|nr:AAA family ATPase [Candidatus Woesearchaeota archaeon]MBT7238166.1 AAA family ATPase [Candidatus Woesearchaeota archaeon]
MSFFIIIRGPLGCGKSTISEKLADILKAKYVAMDRIVDDPNLIIREKEEGYISQNNFIKANEIAVERIKKHLKNGKPIVFDGNFYWKSQIEDLISRLNFPHYVFTLKAPLKVCIERDANRTKTHGKMAAMVVHKKSTEFDYGTLIDVTKPLKECLNKIISYLPIINK